MDVDFKYLVKLFDNINHAVRLIPNKAAVMAVNFSKERFIKKNWVDKSETPWIKTKKRRGSTLISSGRLKQSIRKVHVGTDFAIIGTDVPYARAHNDGGTFEGTERVSTHQRRAHKRKACTRSGKRIKAQTVRAHLVNSYSRHYHRSFPARQFVGQSQKLTNQLTDMIQCEINKAIVL